MKLRQIPERGLAGMGVFVSVHLLAAYNFALVINVCQWKKTHTWYSILLLLR